MTSDPLSFRIRLIIASGTPAACKCVAHDRLSMWRVMYSIPARAAAAFNRSSGFPPAARPRGLAVARRHQPGAGQVDRPSLGMVEPVGQPVLEDRDQRLGDRDGLLGSLGLEPAGLVVALSRMTRPGRSTSARWSMSISFLRSPG